MLGFRQGIHAFEPKHLNHDAVTCPVCASGVAEVVPTRVVEGVGPHCLAADRVTSPAAPPVVDGSGRYGVVRRYASTLSRPDAPGWDSQFGYPADEGEEGGV